MSRIRSNRNGENLLIEEVESQHLLISSEYNFARGVYSCFEKSCREKCTRQSLKALWVVLSSLFEKKFERIGTKGHGNVFASAKGKQQK